MRLLPNRLRSDHAGVVISDRPLTDYYYAAERGFPVPGGRPPSGGDL